MNATSDVLQPGDGRQDPLRLSWWLALPLAALGGLALDAATPWLEWWPAGLLGALAVLSAVWQQRAGIGLLAGLVAGASFWLPHIHWLTLYLGPIPWLGLASVMIAWFGLFGLLAAIATRGLARIVPSRRGARILAQALAAAGLWVAREQLQSTWPYGGFAWGRLAHTQSDGPLVALVSWLGFAGLSGLLAFACAIVAAVLFAPRRRRTGIAKTAAILGVVVSLALLALVPPAQLERLGSLRVAAVQGDSKSGIFDDRENGDVIRDHIDATRVLLDGLEADGERVDLIVWPENSGEFQLPEQTFRALEVQRLAKRAGAPIAVGTVLQDADGTYTNSSVVFDSDGDTGLRYDKRRPVPFAEYMPNRAFFRSLAPDLVDLVQLEYAFGQRPAALPIDTGSGRTLAGIAICFDIIFDDHAVAMSEAGAELVLAQTNNADFGRTDESAQQLQIARLRAVEMGRAVVNISTVGTSAVVLPDGSVETRLAPFTADAMVAEVPVVAGETPALRFGAAIAGGLITLGLAGAAIGAAGTNRARRVR